MQINNNPSTQNFGMALKISKGARKGLENCTMETIERLQKAGADLKDTEFYDVVVADNLSAKITADKDAYFGLFKEGPDGYSAKKHGRTITDGKSFLDDRIIKIENEQGRDIAGVGRYIPYGKTEPYFNAWGLKAYDTIDDVAELSKIAKILDSVAVQKYEENLAKAAAETKEKLAVSNAVGNLLDTFGV